jgi:agmatinase
MNEALVTRFGAPDAPYCDQATARVTIIPAPLEYSVCYMKGTEHGPQAILNASSQMELYDEELDWCPIEAGIYTRPALDYSGMDHASALKATGDAAREVLQRGQLPFTIGGEHSLSAPPIAAVHDYFPEIKATAQDFFSPLTPTKR